MVVLLSDNGASQEGGPFGVLHEWKFFNFVIETPDEAVERLDDIGGPHSHSNYPWGWAQAGNTPFKWYKQNTHEGGVHVPCVVHWPERLGTTTGLRHQFHHVSDVVPTIYEALGVTPPEVYRGYEQMPVTGTSMVSSFEAAPEAPSAKQVQYFEMVGHRGIWADGWKAVTRHQPGVAFDDDRWELYHVAVDRSECHDLAADEPERLAAMIELWWQEAEEHGVLPLDDRGIELFGARFREGSPHRPDRHYTYRPPMSSMPAQVGAPIGGRSWDLDARDRRAPRGRTACSTRPAPGTPGSACSSRTTASCSTTTSSAPTTSSSPLVWSRPAPRPSACGSAAAARRATPRSSSTGRSAARCTCRS